MIDVFRKIRRQSEAICQPLQREDYVVQPVVYVSPPKWHLAHSTWFFETFVLREIDDYQVFNPQFAFLFNSYYEHEGERVLRANRGNLTRPTVDEVYEYRKYVDHSMQHYFDKGKFNDRQRKLIELGLHHEQQHQELLWYDIKFILGHNPLFPQYAERNPFQYRDFDKKIDWIPFSGKEVLIGHSGKDFCYDNERERHAVLIRDFEIANRLVSNGEYREFIESGGYANFRFWLSDGWDWVKANNISAPLYWHNIDGSWYEYELDGLKPLKGKNAVKHISFYEADAFARWKGMRLPTEFEWEAIAAELKTGCLWEITQSAYLPYPGFKIADGAVGEYNGKFMVNQKVLRGGSVATPEGHIRKTYRNFFHADMRWMYSGIRLVKG